MLDEYVHISQFLIFKTSRTDEEFVTEKLQVPELVTTERILTEDSLEDRKVNFEGRI